MKLRLRTLAFLLASVMLAGTLSSCALLPMQSGDGNADTSASTVSQIHELDLVSTKTAPAPVIPSYTGGDTLRVASDGNIGTYSPFFVSDGDFTLADLSHVKLVTTDRGGRIIYNGIDGQSYEYQSVEYEYFGLSDIALVRGDDGKVRYDIKLREDAFFSDGVNITADDVIFTMYVLLDGTYDGYSSFGQLSIEGLSAYRAGMSCLGDIIYDSVLRKGDSSAFSEMDKQRFLDKLGTASDRYVKELYSYVTENFSDDESRAQYGGPYSDNIAYSEATCIAYTMSVMGYAYWEQNESGGYTGALIAKNAKTYDMKQSVPTCDELFSMLVDEHGSPSAFAKADGYPISFGDILCEVFGASYEYFFLVEHQYESSAQSVSGIKKTGTYSLTVTLDSYDFNDIYAFSFYIAPLHVYGSREGYKYTEGRFGFTKGDLRGIRSVSSSVGSGAFLYKGESEGVLRLERNKLYFLGCPYISYVELVNASAKDIPSGIADGDFDIALTELDIATLGSIKAQNSNGELDGDVISIILQPNGLYGYIGLNCDLMKVGDDKMSDASVALRYAFCSVLSYFAPSSVSGYFGEGAILGSYPLDRVVYSTAEDIELYNLTVGGEHIYTSEMTESERRSALRAVVLEYFVAAGYGLDRRARKVVTAPEGASLEFDFWLCTATDSAAASIAAVRDMAEEMGTLGIVVNIVEVSDVSELEAALRQGKCDMWTYGYALEREPQLIERYHSIALSDDDGYENYTRFSDRDADVIIDSVRELSDPEKRLPVYIDCFDLVFAAGAELPLFIRYDATLISAQRTAKDTLLSDLTDYWSWYNVLSTLKLK